MRLSEQPLPQRLNQARLADAGLAGQQDRLTFALDSLFPPVEQQESS